MLGHMPDRDDSVSAAIAAATPAPPDLGTLSPLIQQQLIIDDLLYVASGGPGRYLQLKNADPDTAPLYQQRASAVRSESGPKDTHSTQQQQQQPRQRAPTLEAELIPSTIHQVYQWRVDTRLDRSLRAMVKSLLPACTYYLIIRDFVVEYNHFRAGRVNQALCAAMDEIIQEFHTLIAQLEHLHRSGTESEPFTLQKLTFYLQPSLTMLERLAVLICIIKRQTEQNFLATRQSDYRDYCQEILTHPSPSETSAYGISKFSTQFMGSSKYDQDADYFAGIGPSATPPFQSYSREGDAGPTVEPGKSSLGRRTTAPLVCRGGRTLKVLAGEMLTRCGDPNAKRLYGFLLSRAAKPFLAMLQMWLRRGEVHDPCEEFMIRPRDRLTMVDVGMGELGLGGGGGDHRGLDTNGLGASSPDGWSTGASYSQYVICLDMTPGFLRPFSKKILLSGMYLNIIRACKTIGHQHQSNDVSASRGGVGGREVPSPSPSLDLLDDPEPSSERIFAEESFIGLDTLENGMDTVDDRPTDAVTQAFEGQIYVLQIENAYQYANRTLLWILTEQNHLLNCLRAMKHYFFLDQSDFLTHFLDLAHGELRKPTQEVPLIKLQSLMDVVLQNSASVGAADPYREDVKVDLSCHRFMDQVQLVLGGGGGSTAMPTTTTVSTGTLAQRPDQGTPSSKRMASRAHPPHLWNSPQTPGEGGALSDLEVGTPLGKQLLPRRSTTTEPPVPGSGGRARSGSTTIIAGTTSKLGSSFGTAQPLTCLEALTLDFVVTFPVSLVITPVFVTKYQMIFRHLLQLKHTEHVLSQMWLGTRNPPRHRSLVKKGAANPWRVPQSHQRIWFLRNCMLNSV
ncbi:gamma tubulin complex Spc97/GCP2 subunit Alp4, partial [Dimargaris cristalligena]